MKKFPFGDKKPNNFSINDISSELPSGDEIYKNNNNNIRLNQNNMNIIEDMNNYDYDENDTNENIQINLPRDNHNLSLQNRFNYNNNNNNSINSIHFNNNNYNYGNNNQNYSNYNNIYNNDLNNININNPNQINRINSKSQSFLDKDGNIIYSNNSNQIIHRNSDGPELVKLDSHRIMVGQDEFEDLTKEAREIQNKEAFEKKILGINKVEEPKESKPFFERVGNFFSEHQEGFFAFIDGIGCILLHAPSIGRTIDRIDRWIEGSNDQPIENINNIDNNISDQTRRYISENNKNYEIIMKFLSIWQIKENKKSENNSSCIICLSEFNIGEQIAALPCLHVFHYDCIKNWLKNELNCPVCKLEITLNAIIGQNNN